MTDITNDNATVNTTSGYTMDDLSGFRLRPGQAVDGGYGRLVHPKRVDGRQPQDDLMSADSPRQRGPESAEQNDVFVQDGGFDFGFDLGFD